MKLSFRQGIARFQTDISGNPTFLQKSTGDGNFIDLRVEPDPTIIVFAHHRSNYIVEEVKSVTKAWGPINGSQTVYLYWDVNLLTGELSRGLTYLPPIYSATAPTNPANDQHWFDTTETVMRVWNGAKWSDKIRVFAAYLSSGVIVRPYKLGSQVGIVGDYEGGNIVLDAYNKPLRQSDGTFVTTVTSLVIVNNAAKKVRFEAEVIMGMALEPVPMFSLVQMRAGRRLVLGRSTDINSRIIGLVLEDLYINEVGSVTNDGLVRNEQWMWPESSVNGPVFCGPNGELTLTPPTTGVLQVVGTVYDTDSIYMNIQDPIILSVWHTGPDLPPVGPDPLVPIADFYAIPMTGEAPLTVTFTSMSLGSPSSFEWDFTNDGQVDATTQTASYTYEVPGVYDVRLRAINGFGHDDEIKTGLVTVTEASPQGQFTNLGVQLGGPSQIQENQSFNISIKVSNEGYLTATNIQRLITIPDVGNEKIRVSNLPTGSTTTHTGKLLLITLPVIPIMPTGSVYGPMFFTVQAPTRKGIVTIQAGVVSPETDSAVGDNTSSISIQVRP